MTEERKDRLEELLKIMLEQFITLMNSNNHLLEENLRLLKENEVLRK